MLAGLEEARHMKLLLLGMTTQAKCMDLRRLGLNVLRVCLGNSKRGHLDLLHIYEGTPA